MVYLVLLLLGVMADGLLPPSWPPLGPEHLAGEHRLVYGRPLHRHHQPAPAAAAAVGRHHRLLSLLLSLLLLWSWKARLGTR